MENQDKLFERYIVLKQSIADIQVAMEREIDRVIPEDVAVEVDNIKQEYGDDMKVVQDQYKQVIDWLKEIALGNKENVESPAHELQVVFSNGRVTWDNKLIANYAKTHKEVLAFRKVGKDSAKIIKLSVKK